MLFVQGLAAQTQGCTGADLAAIAREAALAALTESLDATVVGHRHFAAAMQVRTALLVHLVLVRRLTLYGGSPSDIAPTLFNILPGTPVTYCCQSLLLRRW